MKRGTSIGILAILLWSTNIAFSRSLIENLGILSSGALSFILGGLIAILYLWFSKGSLRGLVQQSRAYLLWGGGLFVANNVSLNCAIGLAASRPQVIAVSLLNYLWPALSLIFSVPILKRHARSYLPLGVVIGLAGVWLAATNGDTTVLLDIFKSPGSVGAYLLALIAAVTWGAYSNVSRKWGDDSELGSVPLFILISGLSMAVLRLFIPETTHWSLPAGLTLVYMTLFPTMLAYVFWDIGMRRGNTITVMSLSYLIPLLSMIVSVIVLHIPPSPSLWLAALLVIGGALICRSAIK